MTSKINHEETFKICVDYWNTLTEVQHAPLRHPTFCRCCIPVFQELLTEVRTASRATSTLTAPSPLSLGAFFIVLCGTTALGCVVEPNNDTVEVNGMSGNNHLAPLETPETFSERLRKYQAVLNDVRRTLVLKMARPREVCIHYDEDTGTVDRDYQTDTGRSLVSCSVDSCLSNQLTGIG